MTSAVIRPHPAPTLESPQQVAHWIWPSRFTNAEAYIAPIFWASIPTVVVSVLAHGTLTSNEVDADGLVEFWVVWIAVLIWLLVALGVTAHRIRAYPRRQRELAQRVFEHAIICEVHRSPYEFDGGEGMSTPGRILVDHRVPDVQAARIVHAFRVWVSKDDVDEDLSRGSLHDYDCISSTEVFGPEAAGGYFAASMADEGSWVLLTETPENAREGDEPLGRRAEITLVPD